METNSTGQVSASGGSEHRSGHAQQSQLSAASDSRIEAARNAITQGAVLSANHPQHVQLAADPAQPTQVQFAQANAPIPPEPSVQELAAMAQAVYGTAAPPPGWTQATPDQLAEIGLNEGMLSSPTSEFRAEVYVREFDGQMSYTVAFRGTQSASDWGSNLRQGVGLQTDHYNRALEIGRRLTAPDGSRITITGHSLGGGLASAASLAAEVDAVTFNAAGLSQNTINSAERIAGADGRVDVPDISAFYVRGEILSALQDGGDRVFGGIVGGWLGGGLGGIAGSAIVDMPEAVGERIALDPVRPDGMRWYQDNPVAKHMMNYVISSLPGN